MYRSASLQIQSMFIFKIGMRKLWIELMFSHLRWRSKEKSWHLTPMPIWSPRCQNILWHLKKVQCGIGYWISSFFTSFVHGNTNFYHNKCTGISSTECKDRLISSNLQVLLLETVHVLWSHCLWLKVCTLVCMLFVHQYKYCEFAYYTYKQKVT